jgi:hypothetical protein
LKPSTFQCVSQQRLSSSGTSDTQTATVPAGASGILVAVETTSCRMTLTSAGDPTTTTGLILQKDQMPWFIPVGQGSTLKFASTAAAAAVINIAYLI